MKRVTVSLEDGQLAEIRALLPCISVSAFVRNAVRVALADAQEWEEMLDEALERTGGPLTKEEIAWADGVLGVGKPKVTGKKRSALR